MIYDKLENLGEYPILLKIKKFLDEHKGKILENGKYVIDEDCYVTVLEYETGVGNDYEAHKKYIDLQMLLRGKEYIFVQDIEKGCAVTEYDKEKDIIFYKTEKGVPYELNEGNFLLLDTDDLHKPCVNVYRPEKVKKYVFKMKKVLNVKRSNDKRA